MTRSAALVYEPLEKSDIRLVEILPGRWDDTVACRLEQAPLRGLDNPHYVALSYAWGDPTDTVVIVVNEIEHAVTRSLFTALRRLRHAGTPETPTGSHDCENDNPNHPPDNKALHSPTLQLDLSSLRLWVDALCINQADAQEKALQIPRMKEIYGFTSQVLAWLGENPPEDDALLIRATDYHSNRALTVLSGTFFGNKLRLHLLNAPGCLEAVERLLQRPWFTRVWVIQEVTLPRRQVVLVAGAHQYSLEHMDRLYWAVDCDHQLPHPVTGATRLYQNLNDEEQWDRSELAMAKNNKANPEATAFSIRFAKVQASLADLQASIKHDYLYAILGLCRILPDALAPDYSKHYSEVYRDYARFIFESTGDLSAMMRKSRGIGSGWPSWVPDFSSTSLLSEHHLSQDGMYTDRPTFSVEGTKLHLFAVELGKCVHDSEERLFCSLANNVQMAKHRWRHNSTEGVDVHADQAGASARLGDIVVVPQGLESYNRALILRKVPQIVDMGDEFQLIGTCTVSDRSAGLIGKGLESNVRGITDEVDERLFDII